LNYIHLKKNLFIACPVDRQICTSHRKRRAPTGAILVTTLKYNRQKNPGPAQNRNHKAPPS
ncbi:hypothetical protein LSF37_23590, partial [Escherichia coli]|uniref:hypothetical protein n=1 Tax=Escherichia coli TaxID=562 RepID=UPI0021C86D6D